MATKKLKTGQLVTVKCKHAWAVLRRSGDFLWFESSRRDARDIARQHPGARIVRLNPITGVVSK